MSEILETIPINAMDKDQQPLVFTVAADNLNMVPLFLTI
tara:strand:- start:34132 stop:34248 length:117 start_codon:yes stop_codon:yes gene_type:complete